MKTRRTAGSTTSRTYIHNLCQHSKTKLVVLVPGAYLKEWGTLMTPICPEIRTTSVWIDNSSRNGAFLFWDKVVQPELIVVGSVFIVRCFSSLPLWPGI